MTRIVTVFGFAAAFISTSADAAAKTHPSWMIGQWAWVSSTETVRRGDCPESEFYGRNGYVTDGQNVSRWWIDGDYLVRVTVEAGYGDPISEARHVYRQHFTRTRRDKLVFRDDGHVQWLVRCGNVPPEWEYQPKR
jgi:hypothetical protein